jgi:DNA/RNA endonuclease YhcR with UshA esterase domain
MTSPDATRSRKFPLSPTPKDNFALADDDDDEDEDEDAEEDAKISPFLVQQNKGAFAVFSSEMPRDSIVGHSPPPFVLGDHVELQGLSSASFNGQRGILIFDHGNQRYQIKLDAGEEVRVRDTNLRKVVEDKKPEFSKTKSSEHSGKKKNL